VLLKSKKVIMKLKLDFLDRPENVVEREDGEERTRAAKVEITEVHVAGKIHRVLPDQYQLHNRQTVEHGDRHQIPRRSEL
jgi:hypothetical protein